MAVADILITPARVLYAPVGEPLPDADSVAYGEEWGGNWEDLGYTLTPVTVNGTKEKFELFVEQLSNPVKSKITSETVAVETTLAEITGANLQLGFGGSVTTTPAGATSVGTTVLEAGGETTPEQYAFGYEGEYVDDDGNSLAARLFIFIGEPVLAGQLQFAKAAAMGIPLRVDAKADTAKAIGKQLIKWEIVTAPALGT